MVNEDSGDLSGYRIEQLEREVKELKASNATYQKELGENSKLLSSINARLNIFFWLLGIIVAAGSTLALAAVMK